MRNVVHNRSKILSLCCSLWIAVAALLLGTVSSLYFWMHSQDVRVIVVFGIADCVVPRQNSIRSERLSAVIGP